MAGTGSGLGFGSVTMTGSYSIKATNTATGCSVNMTPDINVTISPLPELHTITGGGNYCAGGSGVHVGLNSSNAGINYQLYVGGVMSGTAVPGTGGVLDFGLQTAGGTYTVAATNNSTGCTSSMTGSATVVINPLPAAYPITGSGSYCAGGTGIALGLSGSAIGVSYQLMRGGTATGSAMTGTGAAFSFGDETAAGTYTVTGTSAAGCMSTMTGSSVININPVPTAYPVTGGGNYCPGGTGVPVGLSGSSSGITYQLFVGATSTGAGVGGVSGTPLSFGMQTTPGNYTVVASNNTTGCTASMSGYVTVVLNSLPTAYNVTGGGNYCTGGAGVHIGLGNSSAGVSYTLYDSGSAAGTLSGTGGPIDFGYQTAAGNYTVTGVNTTTGCSAAMTGMASVMINPSVTPLVTVSDGGAGDILCSGTNTVFTATAVNGGSTPSYQWSINGIVVGTGSTYTYIPLNGDIVGVTMVSAAACAVPATASGSMAMTVNEKETPTVTASVMPGTEVCQGTTVTYSATYTYGGTAPAFAWVKNGTAVSTSSTFSYIPANNDNIYCVMTSNYECRLANTASTSHITMTVDAPLTPVVTISANPGTNIGAGEIVTLTATIVNGGPDPVISWLDNGVVIPGATTNTLTDNFANGDSITCQVISSGGCAGLTGFNSVTMHVANVGVKPVTLAGSNLTLIPNPNNGQFTIKGNVGSGIDEEVTLQVVNMLGQVIYDHKVMTHNGDINERIQIAGSVANGMYLLNVNSATANSVFHFVIEQ
jgi:hypothetical protein